MDEGKNRKRFYWLEGVTRAEVERSLGDRRPSRLHRQGARRVVVALAALLIAGLALSVFITPPKASTYVGGVLLACVLACYLLLRRSVRKIVDAPDELLDERQIAIRDATYTVSYRTLAVATVAYIGLGTAATPDGVLAAHLSRDHWSGLGLSYLMCFASLPSMVLAWRLPSETPE